MMPLSTIPLPAAVLAGEETDLLATYLDDEATQQEKLLNALKIKESMLVRQDAAGLKACLADTLPIVSRLEELTHRRIRILKSIGRRLRLPEDDIHLSAILERAGPVDRERLERAHQRLRRVLVQIGSQNRRNQVLIRNGIEINRAIVHALFGGGDVSPVYDHAARTHEQPPTRPFLDREL